MNYKMNIRYFTRANIGKVAIGCWIAVAIGLIGYVALKWFMRYISACIALIAVIAAIIATSCSVSDKEYGASVGNAEKSFKAKFRAFAEEKLNAHNGRGKAPISIDEEKIKYARAYFFEGQVMFRVGNDGRRRSNKLVLTSYYVDKTTLYLGSSLFSMTEDESDELFGAYPLAGIESISAARPEDRPMFAEYDTVTLTLKNKPEPVVFHMTKDIELDQLVSYVNLHITKED